MHTCEKANSQAEAFQAFIYAPYYTSYDNMWT
jgi:hypothetical protein